MKIIHRYVLKEMLGPFVFGLLFFNFILFMGIIFDLTELIFVKNAPPFLVGKLILLTIPSYLDIIIPIALLFSLILSFGRLSCEGEIIAFRSSGISLLQLESPIFVLAFFLSVVSLFFSAWLTPQCNQLYQKTYQRILLQRPTLQIKENTIIDVEGRKLYTYHLNPENQQMKGIVLYEFLPQKAQLFPQITLAKEGEVKDETLILRKVAIYKFNKNYQLIQRGEFNTQIIYPQNQLSKKEKREKSSYEMSLKEIKAKLKEKGLGEEEKRKLEADFQGRIAIPLATFLMGILAVPLGIKIKRGAKSISLGISLIVIVIYYILFLIGNFLARAGFLPPFFAIWMPNFIMLAAGIFLNLKAIRR
ncbi:LptF/LptG family permease [Candidatus Aerophobetes bacterium]|nr:LptF/LptG family permease [Candidatus Aerophobetes bacterium]